MKLVPHRLALLVLAVAVRAQTPPAPPAVAPAALPPLPVAAAPAAKKTGDSQWVFSLLPKSFQKNPNLELTVITEMTAEGKKLPPVTPAHPAYYISQSSGYHQLGDSSGETKIVPEAEVERTLTTALASNGYRPAQLPALPPTLAIIYTWGAHNVRVEGDADNPALSGNAVVRNLLDRASLVGGEKFAAELIELFKRADALAEGANVPTPPGGETVLGPDQLAFMNPINQFKMRDPKNEFLLDQVADDVYYVVASAYDYQSLATGHRKLLWRTRMTVAAKGVSQEQSVPTLIASAAPYFGREMDGPETFVKRSVREGRVDVGSPTVVRDPVGPAATK